MQKLLSQFSNAEYFVSLKLYVCFFASQCKPADSLHRSVGRRQFSGPWTLNLNWVITDSFLRLKKSVCLYTVYRDLNTLTYIHINALVNNIKWLINNLLYFVWLCPTFIFRHEERNWIMKWSVMQLSSLILFDSQWFVSLSKPKESHQHDSRGTFMANTPKRNS